MRFCRFFTVKLHLEGYSLRNLRYLNIGDINQNELEDAARFDAWKVLFRFNISSFANLQFDDNRLMQISFALHIVVLLISVGNPVHGCSKSSRCNIATGEYSISRNYGEQRRVDL